MWQAPAIAVELAAQAIAAMAAKDRGGSKQVALRVGSGASRSAASGAAPADGAATCLSRVGGVTAAGLLRVTHFSKTWRGSGR